MKDKENRRATNTHRLQIVALNRRLDHLESVNRSQSIVQDVLVEDNAKLREIARHYKGHTHKKEDELC